MSELAPEGAAPDPIAPEAPAEPAWAPSQEEWEQAVGAISYLAELEQRRSAVYQPQDDDPTPELNPFEPTFAEQLRGLIRQEVAPIAGRFESMSVQEGEQRALDILADDAKANGEFDLALARQRANQLLPQFEQKMGAGREAAQAALAQAAKDQRAWEAQFAEQAVARHTNRLTTLAGAPGEPGSQYAVGVQQRTMPDYTKGGSVTQRFFGPNSDDAA